MKVKNCLAVFLCLALVVSVAMGWAHAAGDRSPFTGQGTADDPYCIENTQQIWALARLVNAGDAHYAGACYRLTTSIDLGPADWVPIGRTADTPFRGSFDGDGYAVTGMRGNDYANWHNFQRPELEVLDPETMMIRLPDEVLDWFPVGGFFGVTQGAVIDDLYIEGKVFGLRHCGGLVGWAKDSQIRNCVVRTDQITGPRQSLGTIVGKSEGSLIENSCYIPKYGGVIDLVGQRDGATRIVNSFSTGRQSDGVIKNRSSYCYRADGSCVQVWEQVELPEQGDIAVAITELGRELNAWVDSQEQGRYRHWRTLEDWDDTAWPVLADHLVTLREEPLTDEEECFWFQTARYDGVKGDRVAGAGEDLVYTAMDGRPPRLTGLLGGIEGFRVDALRVDGQEAASDRLPIVTQDVTLDVSYAPSGSMDHFAMTAPAISYSDVDAHAWYGADGENVVEDVTRLGLFVGRGNDCFAPEDPLLLAEAVKLAAVVHSLYTGDGYAFDQTAGEHWFDTYKTYAVAHGLMYDWEFDELDRPATRLETAWLLRMALPDWELHKTNMEQQLSPPDMDGELDRYQWAVRELYWSGVLRGVDAAGSFCPDRAITRAAVAAILTRLVLPQRRF